MKLSKWTIAALGAALLLSGCSSDTSNKLAKIQIAAADRQAQVDKAITTGCRLFNVGKYEAAVIKFGSAARLDPAYLEVVGAAQLTSISATVPKLDTSLEVKTQLTIQIAKGSAMVLGLCNGA